MSRKAYAFILRSRSACHLPVGKGVQITTTEVSTGPIKRIAYLSEYKDCNPTYLRAYVESYSDSLENAVSNAGTIVGDSLQHLALATNSMVCWPEFHVGCEMSAIGKRGQYLEEASAPAPSPPVGYRLIAPDVHIPVLDALRSHKHAQVLCQISSLFAASLEHLDHRNNLFSAELAYIAAEHLARLILDRIKGEEGIPKKQIALRMGLEPSRSSGNKLLDEIAISQIYNNNRELYEKHKLMSEGFEHGFGLFSEIRSSSDEIVNEVLILIRHATLKQLDLSQEIMKSLLSKEYKHPLGGWLPRIHLEGTWTLKAPNCNLEDVLAAQKLEQTKFGSVCFSDFSLNNHESNIQGINQSHHPADISYTGKSISMPTDGRSEISNVEVSHNVGAAQDED